MELLNPHRARVSKAEMKQLQEVQDAPSGARLLPVLSPRSRLLLLSDHQRIVRQNPGERPADGYQVRVQLSNQTNQSQDQRGDLCDPPAGRPPAG